jgi:hypothetical protein
MILLYREAVFPESTLLFCSSKRLSADFKAVKFIPLQPLGRPDIPSGCSTIQASSVRTTRTFCPDLPLCQEASNCSSLHPSGRFRSAMGFLSKAQIWEDSRNCPDDVDSRLDALIHKASRAFKIQTSGR